jgi:TetR/AcrR family transcriptional regulator
MAAPASVAKQKVILQAARERFAHYGFSKVTMEEIAGDIGMAKASLYYYYPTKEKLFQAVLALEQARFLNDAQGVVGQTGSASERLHRYVELRYRLFRELVNLSSLSLHSWTELKRMYRDLQARFEQQELRVVQRLLQVGRGTGEFTITSPPRAAKLFLHVMHGLRLRILRGAGDRRPENRSYTDLQKELHYFTEVFIQGIKRHV